MASLSDLRFCPDILLKWLKKIVKPLGIFEFWGEI
jgi:hypothetical protein